MASIPSPRLSTYSNRGRRLSYLEAGPDDSAAAGGAPVLLFLHGFPFSSAMWEPQIAAFAARCRCLAPDLSGFGDSEPTAEVANMADFAADARALLDHAGVERAVVCGVSMGGYVALALAAAAPERLRGLVLANTRAAADTPEEEAGRRALATSPIWSSRRRSTARSAGSSISWHSGLGPRRQRPAATGQQGVSQLSLLMAIDRMGMVAEKGRAFGGKDQPRRTLRAWRPLGPGTTSYVTRSPWFKVRKPSETMAVWWTKMSSPPASGWMKP